MLSDRAFYFLRESFRNLRVSPLVGALSTIVISLSIFIFGLFLIFYVNFSDVFRRWSGNVAMDVYLVQGIDPQKIGELESRIRSMPEVGGIEYVSAEQARAQFRKMLGDQADLLDELDSNPLPASFRLTPVQSARSPAALSKLADRLTKTPGVFEVRYGAKWVERFQALGNALRTLGWVIGGILLTASILIISNTIRLTVYSRNEEIEIMRLVGATETFIRIPFYLEGLFQGSASGCLAVGMLWATRRIFLADVNLPFGIFSFDRFVFLPSWAVGALIGGGAALGVIGASIALIRFGGDKRSP